jgi:hypothetical protein
MAPSLELVKSQATQRVLSQRARQARYEAVIIRPWSFLRRLSHHNTTETPHDSNAHIDSQHHCVQTSYRKILPDLYNGHQDSFNYSCCPGSSVRSLYSTARTQAQCSDHPQQTCAQRRLSLHGQFADLRQGTLLWWPLIRHSDRSDSFQLYYSSLEILVYCYIRAQRGSYCYMIPRINPVWENRLLYPFNTP